MFYDLVTALIPVACYAVADKEGFRRHCMAWAVLVPVYLVCTLTGLLDSPQSLTELSGILSVWIAMTSPFFYLFGAWRHKVRTAKSLEQEAN